MAGTGQQHSSVEGTAERGTMHDLYAMPAGEHVAWHVVGLRSHHANAVVLRENVFQCLG